MRRNVFDLGPWTLDLGLLLCLLLIPVNVCAQTPGAPGADAHWPGAAKDGFGTSQTDASKVWFTLSNGVMTEAYYPTLDVPNTNALQFIVVSQDHQRVEVESEDMVHRLELTDTRSLIFRQVNTARGGDYTITKTYTTDPQRNTILIDVRFRASRGKRFYLYLYYDPSLNNSGMHDTAWTEGNALLASDKDVASALVSSTGFIETTSGYLGTSDGLKQLREGLTLKHYGRAADGNVVQTARVKTDAPVTLALSFGKNASEATANARASLHKTFARALSEYSTGWHQYIASLHRVGPPYARQFNIAAMVLKALEDKTYRGAGIASPSIPWGGGPNANEPTVSGYHAVWARDLYHAATAFLAMGDKASAERTLDYLFQVQQKPDGTFPQNSRVDGKAIGGSLQLDETAYPLILAYQLGRADAETWKRHIEPAAQSLLRLGPRTEQERWEEKPGYSPSTIAALIAGLVCAAEIARLNGDQAARDTYLETADKWTSEVDHWTATTTGPHAGKNYYLRISDNDDPNDGAKIEINSGGGSFDEREIVDAGFLELVRLGIKRADDPLILQSLAQVDKLIKVETPQGAGWYRYNHDAYGERPDGGPYDGRNGVGRVWTLLTGERGEYELARGRPLAARERLLTMMKFANEGGMIAEQVWDRRQSPRANLRFGSGTGSATPLAWSMAQFIRLAVNLEKGRNLETPDIVAARYARQSKMAASTVK
ncbi:MAG TPA: glycoside hydrolase family 15 protein [Pyrinomonadaceae bacterium]|nr:glycoside hydrolase family 15 protein [Pyrinomonadaceae bacterium]